MAQSIVRIIKIDEGILLKIFQNMQKAKNQRIKLLGLHLLRRWKY